MRKTRFYLQNENGGKNKKHYTDENTNTSTDDEKEARADADEELETAAGWVLIRKTGLTVAT